MEKYELVIPDSITTKEELFAVYTDNIYLGESGITNWDWFWDLLHGRLKYSEIFVHVRHAGNLRLPERDRQIYEEVKSDALSEFPDKILFD